MTAKIFHLAPTGPRTKALLERRDLLARRGHLHLWEHQWAVINYARAVTRAAAHAESRSNPLPLQLRPSADRKAL
jgi:hypothetical protein